LENGLRYGDMNIFHYHAGEDGEGPVLFSMANMVKPGNFDLHSFETFSTVGLSFFLALPSASGEHMRAFELMLSTIQKMASALPGELKDEQRSVLTKQTIEHYRERVRDFSRRQQLQKSKSK
jgi:cell division protein ZipA